MNAQVSRLIPVLLLKDGLIVRSQTFSVHQVIGNPMSTVARLSDWNVDELLILNIGSGALSDLRRDDLHQAYDGSSTINVLAEIAKVCFMPLTFGGGIRTLQDIEDRLINGADKITLNTEAVRNPAFISEAARRFGEQAIVVSIDAFKNATGGYEVAVDGGTVGTGWDPANWAREAQERGAGEIFLNSIDRDGTARGFDLELSQSVTSAVNLPVILCGGVGSYEDLASGLLEGGAAAVAAANIFHFRELSYIHAKEACLAAGVEMRPTSLGMHYIEREPRYDRGSENARLASRLERAEALKPEGGVVVGSLPSVEVRWCTECVYPSLSAAPMEFDSDGVCTGCQMARVKSAIPTNAWEARREILIDLVNAYRDHSGSRYDCVVAVSGGKDSYYQVHVLKEEMGLNPLLVTYDGNNWTDVGWRNLLRMREAFHADHVIVRPSVGTLVALNRQAFVTMGDMNWHAHVGIMTAPMRVAVEHDVPLVFYGEHGYLDLSGQFSMDDFPEVTYRDRLEHFGRGYEWTYFEGREGLGKRDLITWMYPTDEDIQRIGLRGIFLGNYIKWEANTHTPLMIERYGFEVNSEPFDRTYRLMSNLDDMHENGVHDYLKYVKFGYGRATDHASKDIRAGIISRAKAIELVRHYDPIKPRDLTRWLDYVGMSEVEFDAISDTFRDPRVWGHDNKGWLRQEIT